MNLITIIEKSIWVESFCGKFDSTNEFEYQVDII